MTNSDFYKGVNDTLVMLWKQRDEALDIEKKNGVDPRTSSRYLKVQAKIDDYFLPSKKKAQRKKPKKKVYEPENGWAY